ncbi:MULTISPECIES: tetratricopeptide repeat protein [unclassified Saccharopolyspora]|uniref:ATP-binding protein n=1 Tax=unclassified Saccharopolyspora TaxID=2646250 RepID=UPI001CD5B1BB|nr:MULTISPECIES: tetratricopeptide repeat protein [unclassified Saccharopolyspora]MCA1186707.1 tetratricopeptide repeat protein [Saccharopolyspora sp. 6T]MCA1278352.1 tetratricopeptide repeat protein [Saccharopolyspora sp. 7B]
MPGWGEHEHADGTTNAVAGRAGMVIQAGRIDGAVHVHQIALDPHTPRQLPSAPHSFMGRDAQLGTLHAGLRAEEAQDGSPPIVLLCGTAGVGKTALAVQWGHQVRDRFPDGQLYANLQGFGPVEPVEPAEILGRFLRALGIPAGNVPGDPDERAALYRTTLSPLRVLVVLDNAASERQVRPLVPGSSRSHVVVTSRRVLSGLISTDGAELLQLDALSGESSTALLRMLVGNRVDDESGAAGELVRFCCGLPLALRVVGQLASTRPLTPLAELAAELADERSQLDVLEAEDDPATDARAVFSWSYDKLSDEAARAFRMFGVHPGRELDRYAAAALLDTSPRDANRALDALVRAHLLTQPISGRFSMHDLLRVYAMEKAQEHDTGPAREAALRRMFEYYLHAAERADKILTPGRYRISLAGETRESPELPDHESALRWFESELPNVSALLPTERIARDPDLWQMAYTLRGYFFISKHWEEWVRTHELALAAAQQASDRHAEAHTRNNLGLALLEQGLLREASEHYEVARELFRNVGDEHGVSNAMANLATVLHHRNVLEAALRENEEVLARYEDVGNDRNVAITLRSAALVEIDLGRFGAAISRLRRALSIFQDRELHVDAAMALNGLGEAHLPAGNPDEARRAHEQALTLGAECGSGFEQARALEGLGRVALGEGDGASAREFWEDALGRYRRLGAPEAQQLVHELEQLQRGAESAATQAPEQSGADPPENRGTNDHC